jgi:hypothetical protein
MSMHLEFEPHAWYMGFAIKKPTNGWPTWLWTAYTDNGNTYRIDEVEAKTLEELREKIRDYHLKRRTGYGERIAARRLEYLRGELRGERISYGELAELQGLAPYINDDDVELLEPAGVPEGSRA